MAINYTRTYPSSGWTGGSITPSATTASYDQIKASLPPGATETDIIREATRLGILPPAPVLTGPASEDQLRATEERFRQIKAFLPNSQMRFRGFSATGASPATGSGASANPRSGGGNARSGMSVAQGRQGTAIAQGRGSAASVSSGWTAGTVAPQQSQFQVQPAPMGIPVGQAMLTPPRYPGDVPSWLPERVAQLNAGQNFRTDLMGLLFGQGGGFGMPAARPAIDPLIAQGYNQAAQAAAALQRQQVTAIRQPQVIQDQLAYWQNRRQFYSQLAGSSINPEALQADQMLANLQQQLRGATPLATRAAGTSSGWTPAVIPTY